MASKKLFISYRRASWSFTYWLAEELAKLLDVELFIDYSGIDETDFESSLLRNLRESDAMLLIVSEHTFDPAKIHHDKDWVRREIQEALTLKKPIALACYNGLFPPSDLPDDIQPIRKAQGIEFYPRYFKAGIRELADFLNRATHIELLPEVTISPVPAAPVQSSEAPPSYKAMLDQATSLHEAGQYDQAIEIYDWLISEGYHPRVISVEEFRAKADAERMAEQRRWEAGEIYDEIAMLFRLDPQRAAAEYAKFRAEYSEFIEDPAGLTQQAAAAQQNAAPKPAKTPRSTQKQTSAPENTTPQPSAAPFTTKPPQKQTSAAGNAAPSPAAMPPSPPAAPKLQTTSKPLAMILRGHTKQVNSVAFSPDGTLLASGSGGILGEGQGLRLWSVAEQKELAVLGSTEGQSINSVAFNPDGTLLASGQNNSRIRLWSVAEHQELALLKTPYSNQSVAFSPDGTLLASGDLQWLRLWSVAERRSVAVLEGHKGEVNSVVFSPDGKLLASASHDRTVRLWSVKERQELSILKGFTLNRVKSVAFSPDGKLLASGGWDNTVRWWNVADQKELAVLVGQLA